MSEGNQYAGLGSVVKLDMRTTSGCLGCKGHQFAAGELDKAINHYLQVHHYRLLHVGTETTRDAAGVFHNTVAILGI